MKILFLSWNFPPVLGGIEYVVEHLYNGLKEIGHTLFAITSHCETAEDEDSVQRCSRPGLKNYVIYSFIAAFKFCLKKKPDVIICGSIVTAPAAFVCSFFLGVPYVLLMHGSDILYGGKFYQFSVRFLVHRATRLAANSENTKRLLIEAGCKPEKIDVIYPGVCAELYEKEPVGVCEKILNKVKGKKIILTVGRLIKRKGVLEFVENVMPKLIKEYPNVAYLIVGEDATKSLAHKDRLKEKIQHKIDELGLNDHVFLLGKVTTDELTKLYYHCDVFTLPCLDVPGDVEGFGIVFSEAALGGAASLATRIGGIPEAVLDGKTGVIVDVGDYETMTKEAVKLLSEDLYRKKLANAGAERAKTELSWPVITAAYEKTAIAAIQANSKKKKRLGLYFKTLVALLLLVGFSKIAYPLWVNHYGTINADSSTYIDFAHSIATGHFSFNGVLWDFIGQYSKTGEVHPGIVWNTHILKDGTVACTVAIGYPLFLSLMYIIGGTWLLLHTNLLLLYASLVASFLFMKESYKKGVNGTVFAGIATLFVVMLNPKTFNQFSYPWREALFYTLVLFALFFVCRLIKGGKIWWVLPAGFMLGYACAVKEANIIYALAIGIAVIIDKRFWNRNDKVFTIILAILSFSIGVMPLLIQNMHGTGNPLISLQTIRATASYGNDTWAEGMNPHNAHDTIINYINIYKNMNYFSWSFILLAIFGAVVAVIQSFSGRAVFLCFVLHLLLYLQWGNADLRHMFFMNYFYAFFLVYGIYFIIKVLVKLFSKRYRDEIVAFAGVLLLIAYVVKAEPYGVSPAKLDYANMQSLCHDIENSIPDPDRSIVFVNRLLLEQLTAHTKLNVIRYHDLQRLMNPSDMMTYFNTNNIQLYFIDNTDKDPKHRNRYDWSNDDYTLLSQFYNLDKIKTIDHKKYSAFRITEKEKLSLYELNEWSNTVFSIKLKLPDKPVKFLYIDRKGIEDNLILSLDGISINIGKDHYVPLNHLKLSGPDCVVSLRRENQAPIFSSTETKFMVEDDLVNLDYISELLPGRSATFDVPVFGGSNSIPLVHADVTMLGRGHFKPFNVSINGSTVDSVFQNKGYIYCFNNVSDEDADLYELQLSNNMHAPVRLDNFRSSVAYTNVEVSFGTDSIRVCNVIPDRSRSGELTKLHIDGENSLSWEHNQLPVGLLLNSCTPDSADSIRVKLDNGFIAECETIKTEFPFVFMPDSFNVKSVHNLFYTLESEKAKNEYFRWTCGKFNFVLPVKKGTFKYRLKLRARDGFIHPGTRPLIISIGDHMLETTLTDEISDYVFDIEINSPKNKLIPFVMSIEPWSPKKVLGVNDSRNLGFMFHGFEWNVN